jgi:lipopolysaccharide/colanic/teichoic acid biosynthesis glycosyltransferase
VIQNEPRIPPRRVQQSVERLVAVVALAVCSPLLLAAAFCSIVESGWPVLFRQTRVGCNLKPFTLYKLRSMYAGSKGAGITSRGDPRVTRVGAFLRKYKLDELPQLWNVVAGHMRLIGPRPELPSYVNPDDRLWRAVLSERPGLTDLSSLVYRNEEEILARSGDPDRTYREEILPKKLALSAHYLETRDFVSDCRLLLLTARYSFLPVGFDPNRILAAFNGDRI